MQLWKEIHHIANVTAGRDERKLGNHTMMEGRPMRKVKKKRNGGAAFSESKKNKFP